MKSQMFVKELVGTVNTFCRTLDDRPPAYSYIPLKTDEERVRVMQSRLFNELRAADLFGTWLRTTPERQDVARRAVAMRLVLFGEYLSSLDRWAMGRGPW